MCQLMLQCFDLIDKSRNSQTITLMQNHLKMGTSLQLKLSAVYTLNVELSQNETLVLVCRTLNFRNEKYRTPEIGSKKVKLPRAF